MSVLFILLKFIKFFFIDIKYEKYFDNERIFYEINSDRNYIIK